MFKPFSSLVGLKIPYPGFIIFSMEQRGRPYVVRAYDPDWVRRYEEEKTIITPIFADTALKIEHVGSTSIPGMWAKPQIDILVVVNKITDADKFISPMTALGYNYQ